MILYLPSVLTIIIQFVSNSLCVLYDSLADTIGHDTVRLILISIYCDRSVEQEWPEVYK